jgi:hypothetical protein
LGDLFKDALAQLAAASVCAGERTGRVGGWGLERIEERGAGGGGCLLGEAGLLGAEELVLFAEGEQGGDGVGQVGAGCLRGEVFERAEVG